MQNPFGGSGLAASGAAAMDTPAGGDPCQWPGIQAQADRIRSALHDQLLAECEVMAAHALRNGLTLPPDLLPRFDACLARHRAVVEAPPVAAPGGADDTTVVALRSGAVASPGVMQDLSEIHQALACATAPARPATLLLFARERRAHPGLSALGPVAVARSFLMLGLVSLFVMLTVSLSSEVNNVTVHKTLLELSGTPLVLVELFLLSAASLGSCFSNLQLLNRYISSGTYDPKYESTYWMRWVMGVISGVLLSQILYSIILGKQSGTDVAGLPAASDFGEPALALLGGYSAQLVHRIIARLLDAVGTIFGADPRPAPAPASPVPPR